MIHLIKRSSSSTNNKWSTAFRSLRKGLDKAPSNSVPSVGFAGISSSASVTLPSVVRQVNGTSTFLRDQLTKRSQGGFPLTNYSPFQLATSSGENLRNSFSVRCFASDTTGSSRQKQSETRKEISRAEDPFDDITYNIPQKPVTFTEGASYSVIILAGLAVAGVAAYGVFKELIFEPKEYRVFNKSLKRIQDDSQVKVRIGSPITGYGSESRNRAARQRIPNQIWTDDDGVEHVKVSFHIRGSHGAAKVFSEMFKDKEDKQWKFMYLIVEVSSPSPAQIMLESYVPA